MRILFISRSGKHFKVLPFIQRQYESLKNLGIKIDHYVIEQDGLTGYFKAYKYLKTHKYKYDIIHAHYSYCFFPVLLSRTNALRVISFMGSDLYGIIGSSIFLKYINITLSKFVACFSDWIIVKSPEMKTMISPTHHWKTAIVPNGIDTRLFKPISKKKAADELNMKVDSYLLFLGRKNNPRKNYSFIVENENNINRIGYKILAPYPVQPNLVPYYINLAEVLVVPSLKEGSPNVVKEALACNKPVLSTDVGDVKELLKYSNSSSLFYNSKDFLNKLQNLSEEKHKTSPEFFEKYSLESIAKKILTIYQVLLSN